MNIKNQIGFVLPGMIQKVSAEKGFMSRSSVDTVLVTSSETREGGLSMIGGQI